MTRVSTFHFLQATNANRLSTTTGQDPHRTGTRDDKEFTRPPSPRQKLTTFPPTPRPQHGLKHQEGTEVVTRYRSSIERWLEKRRNESGQDQRVGIEETGEGGGFCCVIACKLYFNHN